MRPKNEVYCERCNYDRHVCAGCGENLPHGTELCEECKKMYDEDEAAEAVARAWNFGE